MQKEEERDETDEVVVFNHNLINLRLVKPLCNNRECALDGHVACRQKLNKGK
jgi:hypothetical protein